MSFFAYSHVALPNNEKVSYTIVMGKKAFPYQYVDEQGHPSGVLVDLWREWAEVTHSEVIFKPMMWQQALEYSAKHQHVIHAGLAQSPSRLQRYTFAEPISSFSSYLYLHKSIADKSQISQLLPYQIGVVQGQIHQESLLAIEPQLSIKSYPNQKALLDAVALGKIMIFVATDGFQRLLNNNNKISRDYSASQRLPIEKLALAPAISHTNLELLATINSGFKMISDDVYRQIERRWLGFHSKDKGILIAMQTNVEPFADIGVDGLPQGLLVDLWKLWSQKTSIDIDFVTGNMQSSVSLIKRQLADVHIGFPESQQMRSGLKQAWKVLSIKSRLFSLNQNLITSSQFSEGFRIGAFPTSPYISQLKAAFPYAQIHYFNDIESMVQANRMDEIDGFIASAAMTSHYLLTHKLWPDFTQYQEIAFSTDLYSLTRVNDNELAATIKAGFALISDQELFELEQKWLINPADRQQINRIKQISLTNTQRQYLNSLGAIKLGYVANWAPMEFTGNNGEFLGINAEIKNHLMQQLDISIIPVAYANFSDLLADLNVGRIQMVASIARTPQREAHLTFSKPYWPAPWGVMTHLTQAPVFNVNQLASQRIAIIKGYDLTTQLTTQFPTINVIEVDNVEAGIAHMINGDADMFIDKVATLANVLQTNKYPSLELSLLADLSDTQSQLAVFNGVAPMMPMINRSLATISDADKSNMYQKWITVDIKKNMATYQRWVKILMAGLLALSSIAIVIILSNRRLNIEVRKRKTAENQLLQLAHFDPVTQLANRTLLDTRLHQAINQHQLNGQQFALMFIDLDGFKAVNDVHGHQVGDRLLKEVGKILLREVSRSDTVGRFGGDEFVILLNTIPSKEAVSIVSRHILQSLNALKHIEHQSVVISASIGIGIYPEDGVTAQDLLNKSDHLMYQAKKFGGHQHKLS
ncbi:diguanylate cyclase domain-containing protein [Shewanella intestini]|uniref:Transporter substrate-binding domain-containing protein n=1 Tax=Shewanella intestini TaxID=2017544 RepID=A0ABS5I1U7_9GAMM|nr:MULTISPECIES: transporter substrate-binding domain-containing protein [Shewanella]MBR9727881.1 transporter substrate-binding domain-containing protein [Shewanella intestini]